MIHQETTVVFFGGRNTRIQEHYAMFRSDGQRLQYPPVGVFVDFRCSENDKEVASLYGTVGSSGQDRNWAMQGYTTDKTILPAGDHTEDHFRMSFSPALLRPAARTLTPQFFLEDVSAIIPLK